MIQFVQRPQIGCLAFVLAMAIPGLASAQATADAVLLKTFDISAGGPGPRMRAGDMNGDGRLDFLLCNATDDNPSYVAMLTAYDGVTGKMLWQVGSGGSSGTDRDEPCQIVDIDNDGYNEVLAAMSGQMNIYNGADGKVKSSFALPAGSAHDCIMIANIQGKPIPMDIVVKDRYGQVWAMDNAGKLLWNYSGITGHYDVPFDINGDGKDEMLVGYVVLDQTGKAKYADPIHLDHPDNIWVGDVDGDPTNGFEAVYGLAQDPATQCVNLNSGKVVWTNSDTTESQQILLADYRPDLPGLETYGLDRTVRSSKDSLFLIDSSGKTLWIESGTNGGGGTAIKPVPNWDGTNDPMVLAFKRGSAQVWNGKTTMVHRMPMDGNAMVGDFGGDGKTEILMYSRTTANIYGIAQFDYNTPAPNPGHPMKQTRQNYNWSRYGSSDVFAFTAVPSAGDGGVVPTPTGGTPASTGGTTGSTGGTTASTGGRSGTTSAGGAPATGGVAATGGIISSTGGSTARGGAGGVATGGSPATGGTIAATGGTTSTGGVVSTGGTVAATGGSPSVTGGVATGGAPSSGGVISTGGIPASGGTSGSPIAGTGGTGTNKATANAGGCSCRVAGSRSESSILASLGFLGLVMLRSLRRRRSR